MAVLLCLTVVSGRCEEAGPESTDLVIDFDDARDGAGLWRDTKFFLGYQVVAIGILYVTPDSVSGWSAEQKENHDFSRWWHNVTHPENDSDDDYINYGLHPYWGSAYYVRARERGFNNWEAFGYSTVMSTIFEFGVEAVFEEVSLQDLWVTPVVGSLVGRYFWHVRGNVRERDAERGYRSTGDKWIWVLTDPLGSLNQGLDRMFGWDTEVQLRPFRQVTRHDPFAIPGPGGKAAYQDRVYGFEIQIRWE